MAFAFPGSKPPAAGAPLPTAKSPTQAERDTEYMRQQDARRSAAAPAPQTPSHPPARSAQPMRAPAAYPDEAGVGDAPVPGEGGGGQLPYASSFGPLPVGQHSFLCCVEAITHWDGGPVVSLRVRVGEDAGREFRWEQTPPRPALAEPEGKFATFWKRTLFGAYAAGGWTAEPDPERGWPGWPRTASKSFIPPYVDFFVAELEGRVTPLMLAVTVQVDARYEDRPKVIAVRLHQIDGNYVQAPMPRKVTPWIAERHRWSGVRKDITVKPTDKRDGYVVPSTEVAWDQIPRGHAGLLTLKDCKP